MLKAKERPFFVGGQLSDLFGGRAHALKGKAEVRQPYALGALTATASGSTNTKGSYTDLYTTADDVYGLHLVLPNSNTARDTLLDIAIGAAGSEVVLLSNIFCSSPKATFRYPLQALWPVFIRKGTLMRIRCQSTVGSNTQEVWAMALYKNPFPRIYRSCETMGAATGDSGGTSIDPGGTINTKGAYVQMIAATTRRIRLLYLIMGNQNNSARTDTHWYFDVAIGGAGSEVNVLEDFKSGASSASDYANPVVHGPFPVDIPAGSRVSVRAMCGTNDATDRLIDAVLYGFAP